MGKAGMAPNAGEASGQEASGASEVRLRSLLKNVADMITLSDRDGRVFCASPATKRVSGYTPEEFMARDLLDAIHPEDRPRCEEELLRLAGTPGLSLDLEHRLRHKDGTWRWVEATFTSHFGDQDVGGLLVTVRDITERKRLEAERGRLRIREAAMRAETSERERISRELRDRVAHSMAVV
jgi:PAS domain S-box-containing protein